MGALVGQRLVGDERRHHIGALLGHQPRGRSVDQIAVLDRAHAAAHRAFDRRSGVGMGQHIGLAPARLRDDGADLVLGVAEGADRIGRRSDAAGRHDLDLVGAHLQLLAHRPAHVIDAVGNARQRADAHAAGARCVAGEVVRAGAHVAVAAGLAERAAGDEQPRTVGQTGLDRLLQRMAGAAGVAHGGEAAPQHAAQQQRRAQRHQHVRHVHLLRQIELDGDRMHMQVDQAGHQRLALEIDGAVGLHLERPVGDLLDQIVLDQHVMSLQEVRLKRIEQSGVLEEHAGTWRLPVLSGLGEQRGQGELGEWKTRSDIVLAVPACLMEQIERAERAPAPAHGHVEHAFAAERSDQLVIGKHLAQIVPGAADIGLAAVEHGLGPRPRRQALASARRVRSGEIGIHARCFPCVVVIGQDREQLMPDRRFQGVVQRREQSLGLIRPALRGRHGAEQRIGPAFRPPHATSPAAISSSERPRVGTPITTTVSAPISSTLVVKPNTPAKPKLG